MRTCRGMANGRSQADACQIEDWFPDPFSPDPFSESFEEELFIPSLRRGKDAVAAIAARHHVVKRAFVFDADLPGHSQRSLAGGRLSN